MKRSKRDMDESVRNGPTEELVLWRNSPRAGARSVHSGRPDSHSVSKQVNEKSKAERPKNCCHTCVHTRSGLTDIRPKAGLAWRGAVWPGASHGLKFELVPPFMARNRLAEPMRRVQDRILHPCQWSDFQKRLRLLYFVSFVSFCASFHAGESGIE